MDILERHKVFKLANINIAVGAINFFLAVLITAVMMPNVFLAVQLAEKAKRAAEEDYHLILKNGAELRLNRTAIEKVRENIADYVLSDKDAHAAAMTAHKETHRMLNQLLGKGKP